MNKRKTQTCNSKRVAYTLETAPIDALIINSKTKEIVDRPCLTVAVDYGLGLILGTHISDGCPSAPELDNFKQSIQQTYGIPQKVRPIHKPCYSGAVERYFSTVDVGIVQRLQGLKDQVAVDDTKVEE